MIFYTILLLAIPMFLAGVVWHSIMPFIGKEKTSLKNSISENALKSRNVLIFHRAVHVAISICFLVYSWLLFPNYALSAFLLAVGAIFDIIQVMTLSKRSNHTPMYIRDTHQIAAWLMAVSYLAFSIVIALQRGIDIVLILAYIIWLTLMFILSTKTNHKYFWFAQMGFFTSLAFAMVAFAVI